MRADGGPSAHQPTLSDITITSELWQRSEPGASNLDETTAMRRIADIVGAAPEEVFRVCAEVVRDLCDAGSSGITLCNAGDKAPTCSWVGLAGKLAETPPPDLPRAVSPCKSCVENRQPVLLRQPHRVFPDLTTKVPFCETLIVPFGYDGKALEGAIWAIAHDGETRFTAEHAKILERVAIFTATTLHLHKGTRQADAERQELELNYRELEHRTKNILAITVGLLRHQMREMNEPAAQEAIETASARVAAMGNLHGLEKDGTSDRLDTVVASVCRTLVDPDPRFQLDLDLDPAVIKPQRAATAALVVSELVINALKHGLARRKTGTIAVRLKEAGDNRLRLSVSDDGAPLNRDPDQKEGGAGLNLLDQLANQIGGSMSVEAEPKRFTLTFPAQ
ncbi:ATP-binding protein [Afifella sp. YEN Y35]|uniref:ATP-binding protein n=1 Tax=Afifella sp. YEN Y35 TaxID=3388337 RepID=UPI0039E04BC5